MGFLKKAYSRSPVVFGNLKGKKRISYSNAFVNGNLKFWEFRDFRGIWGMSGAAARTGKLKEKRKKKII